MGVLARPMLVAGGDARTTRNLVVARRSQGRTERLPKHLDSYFNSPEDKLKSGAWKKVARKIARREKSLEEVINQLDWEAVFPLISNHQVLT
ncbi:hypothetical protein WA1_09810 [Scytonema hofmannii PCC 7110]|uniref:Uncharacterized protein n=1 Tax=Scytonema hofmannii PCC 7110 TaxID=128403 RepID=A0A139WRF8_9CYAN|nr:hypothetical protein WA1_09810 [Scytonema hofmannii PCC 7110]